MLLFELGHPTLRLGVVRALQVALQPSSAALLAELTAAEDALRADPARYPEPVRAAVRDVLRVGGYKPTGRGKPASELLLALALQGGLPRIGNLVEINNLVSLESALPCSIFDADKLTPEPSLRFGGPDESYVFNHAGHRMELEGLPVVCRGAAREPVGNAVRDSMLGKVSSETRSVFAVIYGSSKLDETVLLSAVQRMTTLLIDHAGARDLETALLPAR